MKFIEKHLFTILAAVVIACMVIFGSRFMGSSGKVLDVVLFAYFGVILLVIPAMAMCAKILERLKVLEPKVGYASQASPPSDPYSQRRDLEHSLVHSLSAGLLDRDLCGTAIGAFIKAVADAMSGVGALVDKTVCSCGPNAACSNCPVRHDHAARNAGTVQESMDAIRLAAFNASIAHFAGQLQSGGAAAGRVTVGDMEPHLVSAGAQADQRAEAEIVAAGLTAPRVTAAEIQALMNKLTWRYEHEEGSRHTFAHAFLDDFYVATGHNAPVSCENFDAGLGRKYAREQAEGKARDQLWGMEGYALAKALKVVGS